MSVIRRHSVSEGNEKLHQRSCCSITPPLLQENLAGVDEDLIRLSASEALAQASATDAFSTESDSPVMCLTVTSSLKDLEALRSSAS